jgi:predicted kinase
MEAVILIGIQGSGKTTFYRERFFRTHIRLSLDMLRTRRRLGVLLGACIEAKQPFVLDNTNVTVAERARCISLAKAAGFRVIGYFFEPDLQGSLRRNEERATNERIPRMGLFGTLKRLERPSYEEGFDALFRVGVLAPTGFHVEAFSFMSLGEAPQ